MAAPPSPIPARKARRFTREPIGASELSAFRLRAALLSVKSLIPAHSYWSEKRCLDHTSSLHAEGMGTALRAHNTAPANMHSGAYLSPDSSCSSLRSVRPKAFP